GAPSERFNRASATLTVSSKSGGIAAVGVASSGPLGGDPMARVRQAITLGARPSKANNQRLASIIRRGLVAGGFEFANLGDDGFDDRIDGHRRGIHQHGI